MLGKHIVGGDMLLIEPFPLSHAIREEFPATKKTTTECGVQTLCFLAFLRRKKKKNWIEALSTNNVLLWISVELSQL